MLLKVLFFLFAFHKVSNRSVSKVKDHHILNSNDIGVPCSTNTSIAYFNLGLIIDVSANMGDSNLRQIALSLTSELSKFQIGNLNDEHTIRVSIVTYDATATLVANMTQLNSLNDVSTALLGLKSTKSTSSAGIIDAIKTFNSMSTGCKNCGPDRPDVMVFIGASMNGVDVDSLENLAKKKMSYGTFITLNWNPSDALLTKTFNNISDPSFNLTKTDKNLYQNLEWALMQANCYCVMFLDQFKGFNPQTNRWERYAECYAPISYGGQLQNPIYQMCFNNDPLIALTSVQKHDWIRDYWKRYDYYIGLYRNDNGDWVWTDFDGSEIPLGDYQPWAPGYDASSDGDCVHANATSVDNTTISLWVPSTCYPTYSQLFCGTLACDANRTDCAYL